MVSEPAFRTPVASTSLFRLIEPPALRGSVSAINSPATAAVQGLPAVFTRFQSGTVPFRILRITDFGFANYATWVVEIYKSISMRKSLKNSNKPAACACRWSLPLANFASALRHTVHFASGKLGQAKSKSDSCFAAIPPPSSDLSFRDQSTDHCSSSSGSLPLRVVDLSSGSSDAATVRRRHAATLLPTSAEPQTSTNRPSLTLSVAHTPTRHIEWIGCCCSGSHGVCKNVKEENDEIELNVPYLCF
ncbi:hypothetical protein LXL04_031663 [Taraxacum kok-saghyz]